MRLIIPLRLLLLLLLLLLRRYDCDGLARPAKHLPFRLLAWWLAGLLACCFVRRSELLDMSLVGALGRLGADGFFGGRCLAVAAFSV